MWEEESRLVWFGIDRLSMSQQCHFSQYHDQIQGASNSKSSVIRVQVIVGKDKKPLLILLEDGHPVPWERNVHIQFI